MRVHRTALYLVIRTGNRSGATTSVITGSKVHDLVRYKHGNYELLHTGGVQISQYSEFKRSLIPPHLWMIKTKIRENGSVEILFLRYTVV